MHQKTKAIPENLRRLRQMRNYSQDYVAMKSHISQNAYSKIELGYSKLTVDRLLYIADALEVHYTDIIGD